MDDVNASIRRDTERRPHRGVEKTKGSVLKGGEEGIGRVGMRSFGDGQERQFVKRVELDDDGVVWVALTQQRM